jgi:hypothetical protein
MKVKKPKKKEELHYCSKRNALRLCLDLASCLPASFCLNLHDIFLCLGDFLADGGKDDLQINRSQLPFSQCVRSIVEEDAPQCGRGDPGKD